LATSKAKPSPKPLKKVRKFNKRPPTKRFEPEPKDANTVNAIRAKLALMKQYKKLLAEDGLSPDTDDKELESELIKQLIRIEKGLPPKKAPKSKKRRKPEVEDKRVKASREV